MKKPTLNQTMKPRPYRGKTKDGKWVEGWYFGIWEQAYILWGTTNNVPNMTEVIPSTVGQASGINDKNGKEIYEGDKLHLVYEDLELTGKVKQEEDGKWLLYQDKSNFVGIHRNRDRIEIIGTIHDKGKK